MESGISFYDICTEFFSDREEVSAAAFYRELFPAGTFEERVGHKVEYEKTEKGNGFIVYTIGEGVLCGVKGGELTPPKLWYNFP